MSTESKKPSFGAAIFSILFLVAALSFTLLVLGGDPHIPLVLAAVVASLVAIKSGFKWSEIEEGALAGINAAMKAIIILMIIGMIIGSWMLGGVVPAMIYYGLMLLNPSIFLVAICLIACITSLATGSSWTTAGTVGVAAIGIGQGLGVPLYMVAGAVVSGAYFGDKMSPLSDTTNLAPAVTGAELFDHIRHMVYTVTPSLIIALILYAILGAKFVSGTASTENVDLIMTTLGEEFTINPLLLLPAVLVILMVAFKIPAIPGLIGGVILGSLFAVIFQGADLGSVVDALHYGYEGGTGVELVDDLLTRGGLDSMMWSISLIFAALAFGGIMERTRMLEALVEKILSIAKSTGSLVVSTILTCIGINLIAADQYLAIVIPGRMYAPAYKDKGLHPKNLSRVLEDSGTMTSALIPWNTCGAFMFATLGVHPFAYLPFAFLNLLNPIVSAFYGFTGITMEKIDDKGTPAKDKGEAVSG
ncbi:MAG: Na+/H+ antiporter NhaC [Bacillota bacterium]